MKKNFLTIVLAMVTAFALSQSAAVAKSSKHTAKSSSSKMHHKKPMRKP